MTGFGLATATLVAIAVALVVQPPRRLRPPTTARVPGWLVRKGSPAVAFGLRVILAVAAGAVAAVLLVARVGWWGWPIAVLVGAVAAEVVARLPSGREQRREREVILETPQVLDLLAAALSAGRPLRTATAAVVQVCPGAVSDELAGVLQQIELGVGEVDAWRSLRRHPQLGPVAADLARSVESGTMLGAVLAAHAEEARALRSAAVEIAARKVGVRSVLPLMLCFIPAFLLLGIVPTLVSAVLAALAPR